MAQHHEVIDGERLPVRLGGHPALDFCNTWAGWDGQREGDYLVTYRSLAVWSGHAGLLDAARVDAVERAARRHVDAAQDVLERARALRAGLYQVTTQHATSLPWPDPLLTELRSAIGACASTGDAAGTRWQVARDIGLAAPLTAVAWSALGLLSSPDIARVAACPGPGCGWLFLDPSGRRKWCSMATCGNRVKARRFAERARTSRSEAT